MPEHTYQMVLTTCPDPETANKIARAVVEEKLAACVNIISNVGSVYRWQGQVESAAEQLLLIKSESARFQVLMERIQALHPYELPEIIAVPIVNGARDYLAWLSRPDMK